MYQRCKHLVHALVAASLGAAVLLGAAGVASAALDPDPPETSPAVCAATDLPTVRTFGGPVNLLLARANVQPDCSQVTFKDDLTIDESVSTPGLSKGLTVTAYKEKDKHVGYLVAFTAVNPADYIVIAVTPGDPPTGLKVTQEPDKRAVLVRVEAGKGFKVILTPKPKKE
ncbi:hypothetical protein [Nonomuraea sp. NPDC050643]|uniref:hypothetical protein n=1 Tax=Nonomuraea sp. NPDC050643 TaxID=3155660 RepID=UPI0033C4CEBC